MTGPISERYAPATLAALRIAAGLTYMSHGLQKVFGLLGGFGPNGGTVDLMTRFGASGLIELTAGTLIVIGLGTRWAAFIASGEMAVAYFWIHTGGSGKLFWWENRGELVMVYSFVFLALSALGSGPLSLDAALAKKKAEG